jgi:16S rRNA (adenine1518-N6/adenine1519-N6)-dimethyltransferase
VTRSKKRFGQHFLERQWAEKVVRAISPVEDEAFFEIGPGRGAITSLLAGKAAHVVAFEIDRDLTAELRTTAPANVTVVEGDFLDIGAKEVADTRDRWHGRRLRVAGNLPYNVASPILFKLVALYRAGLPIVDATVMLQREVADRLLASAGGREYGGLSVLIGHAARAERLLELPPGAFRPVPKIASTVIRLNFHSDAPPVEDRSTFEGLVQAVFTRRRKTLANALMAFRSTDKRAIEQALESAGIDGSRRPETLNVPEFARLSDAFAVRS